MLAPRPTTLQDLGALQLRIDEIERQIALADDASTQRALALMHLPTRSPLLDAELTSPFGNRGDPINGRAPSTPGWTLRPNTAARSARRRVAPSPSPDSARTTAGWSRSTTATA